MSFLRKLVYHKPKVAADIQDVIINYLLEIKRDSIFSKRWWNINISRKTLSTLSLEEMVELKDIIELSNDYQFFEATPLIGMTEEQEESVEDNSILVKLEAKSIQS